MRRPRIGLRSLPGGSASAAGLLVAITFASAATAMVLRVDGVAGADGAGCGGPATPCRSIQQAVDLAASGDTILVAEAVYVDDVSCLGESAVVCVFQKQLTILGGYASGEWTLPDPATHVTVIDGQDSRRGILVRRGGPDPGLPATSLDLQGFTVRHGRGAGAPQGVGGGLKANFADLTLRDVLFENNQALGGSGGLGGGGGVAVLADGDNVGAVVLERVRFTGNSALGGGGTGGVGQGGGLLMDHAVIDARDVEFVDNTATGGSSSVAGKDGLGGAAAFAFGSSGTIRELRATGNTAVGGAGSSTGGGAFGGGLFAEGSDGISQATTDLTVLDSTLAENTAQGGDGSTAGGGTGGAVDVFAARMTVERSLLVRNNALGGTGATKSGNAGGGGIFFEWPFAGPGPVNVMRNSVVADNVIDGSQGGGAGVRLLAAQASLVHVTLVDNRLLGVGFGTAILVGPRLSEASMLNLDYSILADHTVPSSGRALHVQATAQAGSTADLTQRNLFVGNGNDSNAGLANSGTFVGYPGSNLFDAGPSDFFIDPATSDYHVDGSTPPTDSAIGSSEPVDLDGAARSGSRDLGADEFGASAYRLTVGKTGTGSGTVTSSPAGISCGSDCDQSFAQNTAVILDPLPATGSGFTGWSGDADCSDGGVVMTQDLACTARFDLEGAVSCTAADDNLLLTAGQTVDTTRSEAACVSITAGPYIVGAGGDVTFEAPTVVLRDGFEVVGQLTVVNGIP